MVFASIGYHGAMKMMIGFSAGVATGMYIATKMSDRQRTQLAERTASALRRTTHSVKESTVGESIASNAAKVTNAASERVAEAVDTVGTRAATAVDPDGEMVTEHEHHSIA